MHIAICFFAFNRPKYLKKAIETHIHISGLTYYAFVDYSDKQKEIIEIIEKSGLYDLIVPRHTRYGCNENIRAGIDFAFKMGHDAVIVLEDDLLLKDDSILWLKYILELFQVGRGLTFAVSCDEGKPLNEQFKCWAWGTWIDRWNKIDWNVKPKEKNRGSWDVIVNEYMNQAGLYCFCSDKPRVKHIGKWGTHYNLIGYLKERIKNGRLIHK